MPNHARRPERLSDAIPLSETAQRDYQALTDRNVRIIDQRDPIGSERLHFDELADALGVAPDSLTMPVNISGRCARSPEGATDLLESALRSALECFASWDGARGSVRNGRGGSCYYRPVAISLGNYGASVHGDKLSQRIQYFRD